MTLMDPPGRPRPTLAGQLDRLDGILDGLPETLRGAVSAAVEQALTDAARQAVGRAAQEAAPALLAAFLDDDRLASAVRGRATAEPAPALAVLRDAGLGLVRAVTAAWRQVRVSCVCWLVQAARHSPRLAAALGRLGRYQRRLLWACGVGLATGAAVCWVGPWLGAAAGFLAGSLLALAAQDRHRLLSLLAALVVGD